MEACATADYWARQISALGHEVRLMPPSYVKAYLRRQKNDAADAEAICEAVTRPTMRFVPIKSAERQGVLALHRTRELLVRQRTMLINAMRGHCAEFGIITATALSATIVDPSAFRSGREFAAFLGLVPRQNSSGGKDRLGRISKEGRWLSAQASGRRRHIGDPPSPHRPAGGVDPIPARAPACPGRHRRHGQQDRQDRLGRAGSWRGLPRPGGRLTETAATPSRGCEL